MFSQVLLTTSWLDAEVAIPIVFAALFAYGGVAVLAARGADDDLESDAPTRPRRLIDRLAIGLPLLLLASLFAFFAFGRDELLDLVEKSRWLEGLILLLIYWSLILLPAALIAFGSWRLSSRTAEAPAGAGGRPMRSSHARSVLFRLPWPQSRAAGAGRVTLGVALLFSVALILGVDRIPGDSSTLRIATLVVVSFIVSSILLRPVVRLLQSLRRPTDRSESVWQRTLRQLAKWLVPTALIALALAIGWASGRLLGSD